MKQLALLTVVLPLLFVSVAPATILYDVDFEPPVFTPGWIVPIGAGPLPRDRPTGILAGFPYSVDDMVGLGPCMRLSSFCCEPVINHDVVEFDVADWAYPQYGVAFTIVLDGIEPGARFRGILDVQTGTDRVLWFDWESGLGNVRWGAGGPVIGHWTPDIPLRVRVELSTVGGAAQWRVFLDGVQALDVPSSSVGQLAAVRFDTGFAGQVSAGIDNLLIWGSVTGPISVEPDSWGRVKELYR